MKTLTILLSIMIAAMFSSCGGGQTETTETQTNQLPAESMVADPTSYDPKRGEGKYTADLLALTNK